MSCDCFPIVSWFFQLFLSTSQTKVIYVSLPVSFSGSICPVA